MSVTDEFVEFINEIRYEDLPPNVLKKVKKLILDLLGSILYSSKLDWSQKVVTLVKSFKAEGKSTIIPFGFKTTASAAALANGTMGHGFELDDVYDAGMHHPGAVVIPAALAIGEQEKVDGRQFLLAVVMGYEAMCRVGMAVGAKHHNMKGFHATGTCGPFGSAVAAGKIIGLKKERLIDALGIVGSFCSGLLEFSQESTEAGGMIKRLHAGRASESGLTAALLAKDGFRGPTDIIGGKLGFCNVFSDHPQIHLMNQGLGTDYEIMNVGIKPYPCCALVHPIIDAVTWLKKENELAGKEIEDIEVGCSQNLADHNCIYQIGSTMAAQYSAPFAVALALAGGVMDPENFNKESADREIMQHHMKITKFVKDDDLDKDFPTLQGVKVTMKLKNGKILKKQVTHAKGRPKNEMSFEEVCDKFAALTRKTLQKERQNQIIETVTTIEKVSNISALTKILRLNT